MATRRPRVAATQEQKWLGTFRIEGHTITVFDDPEFIDDPSYDRDTRRSLEESWNSGYYYLVVETDDEGTVIDSISGMAGYAGPRTAAIAFVADTYPRTRRRTNRRR